MAKRNVIWTRTADIQFVGILEYWVKRNKTNTYSKKLVKLVSERTKQIAEKPLIYKSTDSELEAPAGTSSFRRGNGSSILEASSC